MKKFALLSLLVATTTPLAACGNQETGRTINSNGYSFVEDPKYPFVPTNGINDCDEDDYIERDTDCGFPAGYAKKHKAKKFKKPSKATIGTPKKLSKSPISKPSPKRPDNGFGPAVKAPVSKPVVKAPVIKSAPVPKRASGGGFGSPSKRR
jgi:predicted small secreted protein